MPPFKRRLVEDTLLPDTELRKKQSQQGLDFVSVLKFASEHSCMGHDLIMLCEDDVSIPETLLPTLDYVVRFARRSYHIPGNVCVLLIMELQDMFQR